MKTITKTIIKHTNGEEEEFDQLLGLPADSKVRWSGEECKIVKTVLDVDNNRLEITIARAPKSGFFSGT